MKMGLTAKSNDVLKIYIEKKIVLKSEIISGRFSDQVLLKC